MNNERLLKRSRKLRKEEDTDWNIRDVICSKEMVREMLIYGIIAFIIFVIGICCMIFYGYVMFAIDWLWRLLLGN